MVVKSTLIFLVIAFLWQSQIHAQERDSIFLYNGQILIGDIKGGQYGEIAIDDRDLKLIHIKLYKIKRLTARTKFRIERSDKRRFVGMLKHSSRDGWVNLILEDSVVIPIEILELSQVIAFEKSFLQTVNGNLSAGFSYTKSSSTGQINLSTTALYATRLFEYQLSFSANASIDTFGFSRDREDAELYAAYNFATAWFLSGSLKYQRNLELAIARRYQETIGTGNKLFLRKNWQLQALSGIAFTQEKSTENVSSGLLLEVPVALRFNFFKYHHPNIQITSTQSLYMGITQAGRVRYSGDAVFSWEIVRYFNLNFNPYANYDNQTPDGNNNFDFGVVFSISYKF